MPVALALLASLLPILLWLAFFYSRDRYEREPKWLIARLFLWGLIAGPWASGVNVLLAEFLGPAVDATFDSALALAMALLFTMVALGALNEETMKYVVVSSRTRGDPNFNEPVDGVIYMTTAALGFAAGENFVYILSTYFGILEEAGPAGVSRAYLDAFLVVAPLRALISTIGHVTWSGIVGYYLARHVLAKAPGRTLVGGILLAAGFHTAYNLPLFLSELGLEIGWASWLVWIAGLERYLTLYGRALSESPFRGPQLEVAAGRKAVGDVKSAFAPAARAVTGSDRDGAARRRRDRCGALVRSPRRRDIYDGLSLPDGSTRVQPLRLEMPRMQCVSGASRKSQGMPGMPRAAALKRDRRSALSTRAAAP